MSDTLKPTPIPVAGLRVCPRTYDGYIVVELHGDLDIATAPSLERQIRTLPARWDAEQVIVDVSRLAFVSLKGADALRRVARAWGPDGRLTIRGTTPMLDTVLAYTGDAWFIRAT